MGTPVGASSGLPLDWTAQRSALAIPRVDNSPIARGLDHGRRAAIRDHSVKLGCHILPCVVRRGLRREALPCVDVQDREDADA